MSKYFENQKIAYSDFWNQCMGDSFNYDKEFMKGLTDTTLKASEDLHRAKIDVVFSFQLDEKHHLRVFEISEINEHA